MRALWVLIALCSLGCNDDFILPTAEVDATGVLDLTGNFSAGENAFDEHCVFCHEKAGENDLAGPALNGVFDRITDADAVTIIQAGQGAMPAIDVTDQETADLLTFMRERFNTQEGDDDPPDDTDTTGDTDAMGDTDPPDTDPPAPDGEALYGSTCIGCHRLDGSGPFPDMAGLAAALDDDGLKSGITNGVPGTAMSAYPDYTEAELDALVTYIRATFTN